MAEAEDVIVDAARHATVFMRDLWLRNRSSVAPTIDLPQVMHRLDVVIAGVFGSSPTLHIAQPPAPTPFVRRLFRSYERPIFHVALPSTDGISIWLPAPLPDCDSHRAVDELRIMALQQAARACRGTADKLHEITDPLQRAVFEVLEADAGDTYLLNRLAGLRRPLNASRAQAASLRPALDSFPPMRRPLEAWVKRIMETTCEAGDTARESTPDLSMQRARELAAQLSATVPAAKSQIAGLLYRDHWTGQLRSASTMRNSSSFTNHAPPPSCKPPRSARLTRRPDVREPDERDERANPSPWMIQTAQPLEHAEDPFGMQRPVDRDENTEAEEFADSVSELAQARLVTTPGSPQEVLLSDDPPAARGTWTCSPAFEPAAQVLTYPEWDWRARAYRDPGSWVYQLSALHGSRAWVERTLQEHRVLLNAIRRQFESLRATRLRLRQQADGEEIDIDACIDGFAAARAGTALPSGLYQTTRPARRELAILLLIDTSGSTDGWVSNQRRVIDVEREALLLVCLALESLSEPFSVIAFSGEGPHHVTVRTLKSFTEPYGDDIALRIAGLEPEHYTRTGAALRHASAVLMREPARHRLLLMLSDGRPNDVDEYDGRYGIEDMRQAVVEARLQGIFPFCLTVDRHTANYLPAVFGEHQYAVLHRPELLPTALVGWLRRLVKV